MSEERSVREAEILRAARASADAHMKQRSSAATGGAATKTHGATDYNKWSKFNLKDYGIDEKVEAEQEKTQQEQQMSPQEYEKAYKEYQDSQKRLEELKVQEADARKRLAEMQQQKAFLDKLMYALMAVMFIGFIGYSYYISGRIGRLF